MMLSMSLSGMGLFILLSSLFCQLIGAAPFFPYRTIPIS